MATYRQFKDHHKIKKYLRKRRMKRLRKEGISPISKSRSRKLRSK